MSEYENNYILINELKVIRSWLDLQPGEDHAGKLQQ